MQNSSPHIFRTFGEAHPFASTLKCKNSVTCHAVVNKIMLDISQAAMTYLQSGPTVRARTFRPLHEVYCFPSARHVLILFLRHCFSFLRFFGRGGVTSSSVEDKGE